MTGPSPGTPTNKVAGAVVTLTMGYVADSSLHFVATMNECTSNHVCLAHVQVHVFAEQWALQGQGYEAVTFSKSRCGLRGTVSQRFACKSAALRAEGCITLAITASSNI